MITADHITREIDKILAREGGFSDNPADAGGRTAFGVTQETYDTWMKFGGVTHTYDVSALTRDTARAIYRDLYIHRPGFDNITDPRLFSLVVDSGVQHGTGTATKWLQAALGVTADGVLGAVTRAAVNHLSPEWIAENERYSVVLLPTYGTIYKRVLATRLRHYAQQCVDHPNQLVFLRGWTERMIPFIDAMELPT